MWAVVLEVVLSGQAFKACGDKGRRLGCVGIKKHVSDTQLVPSPLLKTIEDHLHNNDRCCT